LSCGPQGGEDLRQRQKSPSLVEVYNFDLKQDKHFACLAASIEKPLRQGIDAANFGIKNVKMLTLFCQHYLRFSGCFFGAKLP
jgi:hypothetical protein